MALPNGMTAHTHQSDLAMPHSAIHRALSNAYNRFFDGNHDLRSVVIPGSDTATEITNGGIPGLTSHRARRFTLLDGDASDPVTGGLTTAYISRFMRPTGGVVETPTSALQVVAAVQGPIGVGGFMSANGILSWAVGIASDADGLGISGAGLLLEDILSASKTPPDGQRTPTTYGGFALAETRSPYGAICAFNPFVAPSTDSPWTPIGVSRGSGVFLQSFPTARHVSNSKTATFTNGSSSILLSSAHGLLKGDSIIFTNVGGAPATNFAVATVYFVTEVIDTTHVRLAATLDGAAIVAGSNGTGVTTMTAFARLPGYMTYSSYPDNVQFESSFLSPAGAAYNASFDSRDSAINALVDTGSHVDSIDLSGATVSGTLIKLRTGGFSIASGGAGNVFSFETGVGFVHNTGTHITGIFGSGAQRGFFDGAWTPAANETFFHLYEGVTPTARQVQWKDGAAIGGGDKVMVLV